MDKNELVKLVVSLKLSQAIATIHEHIQGKGEHLKQLLLLEQANNLIRRDNRMGVISQQDYKNGIKEISDELLDLIEKL